MRTSRLRMKPSFPDGGNGDDTVSHRSEYTPKQGAEAPNVFSKVPNVFITVSTITEFSCAIKYLFQPQICSLHI